jgi:hypothetical protein
VFHGHAHHGTFRGQTPGGVPVFNVSMLRVREDAKAELFFVYEIAVPADTPGEHEPEPGVDHPGAAEQVAGR